MSNKIVLICMLLLISTSCIFAKQTATATRTLTVVSKLVMATTSIPAAVVGVSGSVQLAATGGVLPYTYRATDCVKVDAAGVSTPCVGVLPPGYTLTPGGLLTWTPTESGKFQITFEAADSTP